MSKGEDKIKTKISWRIQAPVYGAGMFASTVTDVISIILPVWLAGTGKSAATIGLIIGAKHILPFCWQSMAARLWTASARATSWSAA